MKHLLLASTALVMTAGIAAAEVTVGGDGRMGVHYDGNDWNFTSRIRISFSASGETDGGLTFGGSVRVDHYDADQALDGSAGNVYISGAFGKLSMGDVDSAAEAAVGQVSGVGLTALEDLNEISYIGKGASTYDPVLLYEYSFGDATIYASLSDGKGSITGSETGNGDHPDPGYMSYGVGVTYSFGNYSLAAGYEANNFDDDGVEDQSQIALGGTASFGDATIKAVYSMYDFGDDESDPVQYALSVDYTFGMATLTAFYAVADPDIEDVDAYDRWGLGASYDLGGGASLKGGIVNTGIDLDGEGDPDDGDFIPDFGVSMTF